MRLLAWALLLFASLLASPAFAAAPRVIEVSTSGQLVAALDAPLDHVTVVLSPGDYVIPATLGVDRVLDCLGDVSIMPVTTGLTVRGNNVRLVGPRDGQAMIVTDAGYKIFFKDCKDCELERIKVMGPPRDEEHTNHDAVVVATNSSVRIANCWLITDIPPLSNPPTALSGGDAIRAGEGADLVVEFNEITCFAWGIVLQKGSRAVIRNNVLEGVSMRKRGAIRVACDADARAERNLIRGFPRGVEVWRSAIVLRGNILEEMTGDGIFVQSPGAARVTIEQNALYRCGAIGARVEAGPNAGVFRNLIVDTGRVDGAPNGVRVSGDVSVRNNTFYQDGAAGSREIFWRARRQWTRTYRNTPVGVDGRHKFHESAFLTRYGRWTD